MPKLKAAKQVFTHVRNTVELLSPALQNAKDAAYNNWLDDIQYGMDELKKLETHPKSSRIFRRFALYCVEQQMQATDNAAMRRTLGALRKYLNDECNWRDVLETKADLDRAVTSLHRGLRESFFSRSMMLQNALMKSPRQGASACLVSAVGQRVTEAFRDFPLDTARAVTARSNYRSEVMRQFIAKAKGCAKKPI